MDIHVFSGVLQDRCKKVDMDYEKKRDKGGIFVNFVFQSMCTEYCYSLFRAPERK